MIQRRLQDPLAQLLLEGKIADGATVKVSASKTGLTINGQEFAAQRRRSGRCRAGRCGAELELLR